LIGNERQGTSLIERGHMTRLAGRMICFGLAVGLSGCNKKPVAPPLPAVLTPVALEDIPEPDDLPEIAFQPLRPPPPVVVARNVEPKRQRKKPAKVETPAEPTQVAAAEPSPEVTAIGSLTAGGEASPQTKQEAEDLIASSEKRLNALSAQKAEEEKAQVSKVKNFLKDAQDALKSGDAEGAKTLATKAKLLLDDLEK
jgi:ribosomal protein S20